MQPFEVAEEPGSQHADLAAGKRDSMIGLEGNANLLPLPVVKKTLQPDMNHDIVAKNAPWWDKARQSSRLFLSPAAGSTNPDGLPEAEATMAQGHPRALPGFRDPHGLAANGTRTIGWLCIHEYARNTPRPLPALRFQLTDRLLQACDLRKRDGTAVFFTPYA